MSRLAKFHRTLLVEQPLKLVFKKLVRLNQNPAIDHLSSVIFKNIYDALANIFRFLLNHMVKSL